MILIIDRLERLFEREKLYHLNLRSKELNQSVGNSSLVIDAEEILCFVLI